MVKAQVIPDGAIRGTKSNAQKLRELGARPEVVAAASRPTRAPTGMDFRKKTLHAEIEQMQKKMPDEVVSIRNPGKDLDWSIFESPDSAEEVKPFETPQKAFPDEDLLDPVELEPIPDLGKIEDPINRADPNVEKQEQEDLDRFLKADMERLKESERRMAEIRRDLQDALAGEPPGGFKP